MAFGKREPGVPCEGAEYPHPDPRQPVFGEVAMTRARDLVEDHARDRDPRIEARAAERHRGGGLGLPRHVEHQHHGPPEARRDIGARAGAPRRALDSVEEAHRAFRDHDIGRRRRQGTEMRQKTVGHREAVEVEARRPRGGAVKGGVDIIGAAFGSADAQPPPRQRALEAERERRFAGSRARGRDEDSGRGRCAAHAVLARQRAGSGPRRDGL